MLNGCICSADLVKVWSFPDGTEVMLASDGYRELESGYGGDGDFDDRAYVRV